MTTIERIKHFLTQFGIYTHQFRIGVKGSIPMIRDFVKFKSAFADQTEFTKTNFYPLLADRFDTAGVATGHYFHQDLLVAQKIFLANPRRHVDVGSRIDGFVSHVASFRQIEIIDIRKIVSKTDNILFRQADLMSPDFKLTELTPSLSCLHTIEHFGLGRYGDPFDLDGHRKGFKNLVSCLEEGGIFYFSTPIGNPRIEFNAHRVFSISILLDMFNVNNMEVQDFAFVDDNGDLQKDQSPFSDSAKGNFGLNYGCGIFTLVKKTS